MFVRLWNGIKSSGSVRMGAVAAGTNQLTRRRIKRYTGGYMKPLPAPSVPGNTEAERSDNAVRKTFTVSKEEMQRREADWQKTNGEKVQPRKD
jgi:hypothetical protein